MESQLRSSFETYYQKLKADTRRMSRMPDMAGQRIATKSNFFVFQRSLKVSIYIKGLLSEDSENTELQPVTVAVPPILR